MAVGGDGTFHEVVNGMLKRKDKKKIPVGFLPNGSANDTNLSFGVNNLDQALDYLTKGESMKMDIVSCLVDYQKVDLRMMSFLTNPSFYMPGYLN